MAELIVILLLLWLGGIVRIPWLGVPHFPTISLRGYHVRLELFILAFFILWISGSLGSPLRQILWALVILWLLSFLGIVVIGGLTNLVVIALIVGLILGLVQGK